ncbi:hypothetical protein EV363DRAFT_1187446 [Boletus edulis]|uniref:Uncharacterized protein n=1 Tax=Boletus edulis BED1 TaxID=1328754 RepID=A0AAD4B9W3_BOLED|nr:hypothetical protein EV363DRAFT_1187446 [Boletus edulis]KAF8414377.1 hypothetical protein L210DRAFT_3659427 [Boletus edulis BED1]
MSAEIQMSQRAVPADRSFQDIHRRPTIIQTSRAPIADLLLEYVEKARQLDGSAIDNAFAKEHPFLYRIRCSSNLLSAPQRKSKIIEFLASKRALISQLVKLETLYDSLRAEMREEEGRDATDAFCRANYGVGDGWDAESVLAIAYMELTFQPLSFPGLDARAPS